jgi:hypothetical protein
MPKDIKKTIISVPEFDCSDASVFVSNSEGEEFENGIDLQREEIESKTIVSCRNWMKLNEA